MPPALAVALVTLGCARNDVDSEEIAGRLQAAGWALADDPDAADVVVVNTCGFIASAKKDSVDAVLEAAETRDGRARPVVAVGCLAERYGGELAESLPEAAAVLGFDDYPQIAARLGAVLDGARPPAPVPGDRRLRLPLAPVQRAAAPARSPRPVPIPPSVAPWGPRPMRARLDGGPTAPLKLASGCDRRCAFCAIPRFRGAFVSRPPEDLLGEARWLAEQGVRELFLVSENTTSYGKDLGDVRLLERVLAQLAAVDGLARIRLSYLQPAEVRPSLLDAITATPAVVDYFDLSFQHASGSVLRRMRRFGDGERFLDLLGQVRARSPQAGIRSNVIVGFPGETEADLAALESFLEAARLDVVGVFGYSDEDGTEAAGLPGHLPAEEIAERVERVTALVEQLTAQRAEDRCGQLVEVLAEQVTTGRVEGRAAHQGPEVDGTTVVSGPARGPVRPGDLVPARVTGSVGVDLVATALPRAPLP